MNTFNFILASILWTAMTAFGTEFPIKGSISTHGQSAKNYSHSAKISSAQAIESAKKVQTGRIVSTSLEDENGSLIYAIQVLDQASQKHEILVDAGNGKVLDFQNTDNEGSDKAESE